MKDAPEVSCSHIHLLYVFAAQQYHGRKLMRQRQHLLNACLPHQKKASSVVPSRSSDDRRRYSLLHFILERVVSKVVYVEDALSAMDIAALISGPI